MKTVIKASNISKKFKLHHESKEKYVALRDVITNNSKNLFSFKKKQFQRSSQNEIFWALKNIDFEIKQGDRVGIVGRNGAGKSTLLKILSRITSPSTGSVSLKGRVASLLEVGTGFHPELTGRENIFLNGTIMGMSRAEIKKQFDAIVQFAEVERFLDTPVKRYSSGMYVRLAFAIAAHLEPEILLIDEVLAVGDAQFQKKCLGKMEEVSKNDGRTILFVSHNISMIQKLCNTGMLLTSGQLTYTGDINQVISHYLDSAEEINNFYEFNGKISEDQIAYAKSIKILSGNNEDVKEIPVGEPWKIEIKFSVQHNVNGLIIGLGMLNEMDVPIRTSWTIPQNLLPGDYTATFLEDGIYFSPGTYRMLVGISIGKISIQYIDKDIFLHISDVIGKHDLSVVETKNGIFLNQMKMNVIRD